MFSSVLAKISSVLAKIPSVVMKISSVLANFSSILAKISSVVAKISSVVANFSSVVAKISYVLAKIPYVVALFSSVLVENHVYCNLPTQIFLTKTTPLMALILFHKKQPHYSFVDYHFECVIVSLKADNFTTNIQSRNSLQHFWFSAGSCSSI